MRGRRPVRPAVASGSRDGACVQGATGLGGHTDHVTRRHAENVVIELDLAVALDADVDFLLEGVAVSERVTLPRSEIHYANTGKAAQLKRAAQGQHPIRLRTDVEV
mmetsp:Transcript_95/g.137  ORF Transcript_95/g.137 Transcript_95/m.137 type:complete len:106 (-) Transcript_95:479-796(-)